AVLNSINTRLDARTIAYILEHGEARVLLTDREFAATVGPALEKLHRKPLVIEVDDALYQGPGDRLGEVEYEAFLATGSDDFAWTPPADESAPITLNYTSGTTGNPKGVVYHHRGAFLESVGNIMMRPLPPRAARQGHPRDERDGLQRHAPLRSDRGARALDVVRAAGGVGDARARRARREGGAPGRALSHARRPDGGRPQDAPARAGRRAHDRRGHAARQHRDARLSERPDGDGRGVRGRVVSHRRPRRAASRRLHGNQGPRQGHHHLRR